MIKDGLYYICSPLSADTREGIRDNMLTARRYMGLVSKTFGCRAVAPHAYLPELLNDHDSVERQLGLSFGLGLLKLCQGMIICGDKISSGMYEEFCSAVYLQIPVYQLMEDESGVLIVEFHSN